MAKERTYKSEDVIQMIRQKYCGGNKNSHVVIEQVPSATGFTNKGWIDAMVFSLWPSKGTMWGAYEVKVARNDFLRELEKPDKNAWCREHCHEFWFVAPRGVIKDASEVPEGDGWLVVTAGGLRIERAAMRRTPVINNTIVTAMARAFNIAVGKAAQTAVEEWQRNNALYDIMKAAYEAALHLVGYGPGGRGSWDMTSAAAWREKLNATLIDKDTLERVKNTTRILNSLQGKVLSAFELMAPIGHGLIEKVDEANDLIMREYGIESERGKVAEWMREETERLRRLKSFTAAVANKVNP